MNRLLLYLTVITLTLPIGAVEVSRSKLDHPALGTVGGASLHSTLETMYVKIGDNANSRYEEYSAIADSGTVELDHNFGVNLDQLNVLIYSGSGAALTRIADPESQSPPWTIQEKTGSEKTIIEVIAPSAGGPHTFAVAAIHGKGSEKIDDLSDVDVTTVVPAPGETIVWNGSNFVPGASGDASFKLESVTDPNALIKGGKYGLTNRRQLASYDGVGSTAVDFQVDLTCDLDAILGTSPSDNTTYNLFIDLSLVGNTPITTTDTGEEFYPVECADLALLQTFPESTLGSRYVPIGFVHSADTGTVWSGTGAAVGTFAFRIHDQTYVTVSPVIYSLADQAVGTVGTSGQKVGGHFLKTDSFEFTFADDIAFYNLVGDALDDSAATSCTGGTIACDLTNNGTITFSGDGILGNSSSASVLDGSTQWFSSTDAFFQHTDDISVGGWFLGDTWAGAVDDLFSQWLSASTNRSFTVRSDASGLSMLLSSDGGGVNTQLTSYQPSFVDGTWHHVAYTHDDSLDLNTLYVDGVPVLTTTFALHEPGSAAFNIGALENGANFDGRVREFFYADRLLPSEDIRKLASSRIDHNQNVALADQNWLATFSGGLSNQLDNGWIVDKSADTIWFDFFDLASTDNVSLKLKNENATAHVLPLNTFDSGFLSSAPSFPLSHGLGSVPAQVVVIHEGQTTAGDYDDVSDKCSWDDTQITCNGLNTIDGTNRLRIVMSTSTVAVAVAAASATESGIVTTQTQTFAGNKGFDGNTSFGGSPTSSDVVNIFADANGEGLTLRSTAEAEVVRLRGVGTGQSDGLIEMASQGTQTVSINSNADSFFNGGDFGFGISSPDEQVHIGGTGVLKLGNPTFTNGFIYSADDINIRPDSDNNSTNFITFRDGADAAKLQFAEDTGKTELSVRTDSNCGIGNVCSGEATQTFSGQTNVVVSAAGGSTLKWSLNGKQLFLSFGVNTDLSAATGSFEVLLPNSFTVSAHACSGTGQGGDVTDANICRVRDDSSSKMVMNCVANDGSANASNQDTRFTVGCQID